MGKMWAKQEKWKMQKLRKLLFLNGGAERARTADLIRARDALSQTELLPHEAFVDYAFSSLIRPESDERRLNIFGSSRIRPRGLTALAGRISSSVDPGVAP